MFKPANFSRNRLEVQRDENLVDVVNKSNEDAISEIGTVDDGTEKFVCLS